MSIMSGLFESMIEDHIPKKDCRHCEGTFPVKDLYNDGLCRQCHMDRMDDFFEAPEELEIPKRDWYGSDY
jgi:hypothetical protein